MTMTMTTPKTKRIEIYKCEECGNIVDVLHEGLGNLSCCNKPMKLFRENTTEGAKEKHIPVIQKIPGGVKVLVGSQPHPMEEKHYIEWIEIRFGDKVGRKFLRPGDKPEATFMGIESDDVKAREYCNIHGLWKSQD